jgi:hypothetical protein
VNKELVKFTGAGSAAFTRFKGDSLRVLGVLCASAVSVFKPSFKAETQSRRDYAEKN